MTAGRQVTGEDDGDEVEEESGGATAEQKQENRRDDGDSDCDGSGRGLKDGANAISSPLRDFVLCGYVLRLSPLERARKIVNVGENRAQNGVRMLPESRNEDRIKIWPPWTRAMMARIDYKRETRTVNGKILVLSRCNARFAWNHNNGYSGLNHLIMTR
ncbi:hypothetical protein E3N88_14102 [Mikania micrantha]|uniref:Uncharacterized protein n=1 Tax=Mikania micrantha TaxID=192012 RepID=A0A5N6P0V3_9ASTR|nr:hypothetical protein E3N88_14102 [Mikania micrantha]